jgi:hypothetical protein
VLALGVVDFFLFLLVYDRMLKGQFGSAILIASNENSHESLAHVLSFETGKVEIGLQGEVLLPFS